MLRLNESCWPVILLVAWLHLLTLGCQSNPLDSANGEERGRPTQGAQSGDLRLTMEVPEEVSEGGVVRFQPTITNLGEKSLEIEVPGGPLFEVYVTNPEGTVVWNNLHGGFVPLPLTILTLSSGEQSTRTVEWDQKGNDGARVQPGSYLVFATFWLSFEPDLKTEPQPIRIVE